MGCLIEDTKSERDNASDYVNRNRRYNCVLTPYNGTKDLTIKLVRPVARQGRLRQRKEPIRTHTTDTLGLSQLPVRKVLSGKFVRFSDY